MSLLRDFSPEKCREIWKNGEIAAAGEFQPEVRKFGPPEEEVMAFLCREAKGVYIEADGSRCLPLKYPSPWEPVIRSETTHVIVLAGLSALGRKPEEVFHRLALAREHMDIPEETVTEELMARVLWAGYGKYDPIFFLNQADTPELRARGEAIAALLLRQGAKRAVTGSLRGMLGEDNNGE